MTKKKVEVNEDVLKNIIVGDIPIFGREKPKEESTEQPDTEVPPITEPAAAPEEKPVGAKRRKKKEEKQILPLFRPIPCKIPENLCPAPRRRLFYGRNWRIIK